MGQVAMTIAPAQITDRRNGSITQTLVAIIARTARTPRVMRGRSTAGGGVFMESNAAILPAARRRWGSTVA